MMYRMDGWMDGCNGWMESAGRMFVGKVRESMKCME